MEKKSDFIQEERNNHGHSKTDVPSVRRWMEKTRYYYCQEYIEETKQMDEKVKDRDV